MLLVNVGVVKRLLVLLAIVGVSECRRCCCGGDGKNKIIAKVMTMTMIMIIIMIIKTK